MQTSNDLTLLNGIQTEGIREVREGVMGESSGAYTIAVDWIQIFFLLLLIIHMRDESPSLFEVSVFLSHVIVLQDGDLYRKIVKEKNGCDLCEK